MRKYSVGDKVVIRSDLIEDEWYDSEQGGRGDTVNNEMLDYVGSVATITGIGAVGYRIDLDRGRWCWTFNMIEKKLSNNLSLFQEWEKSVVI